jgi:phosphoribosylaminoimidazole-succinocarboxamide synthase
LPRRHAPWRSLFTAAAAEHAATRGIIIADTKFEFGLDAAGTLHLIDEVTDSGLVALLASR